MIQPTPEQRGVLLHLRSKAPYDPVLGVAADLIEQLLREKEETNRLAETLKRGADEIAARLAQHK